MANKPTPQDGISRNPQSRGGGATQTSGSRGEGRQHGVKDIGSVGRDVPDQSKEKNTEIAVEFGHRDREHPGIAMAGQPGRDRIADEAVGTRESGPPYAGNPPYIADDEASRRSTASSGVEASTPEKTAEALGEPVGAPYSDPKSVTRNSTRKADRRIAAHGEANASVETLNLDQRFLTVVASFALGYLAAVLFHPRLRTQFDTPSGPYQITKPPIDNHPRGFVQSTVLKIVSEHPQGMTSAEITQALGREGIEQQSIGNALSALTQAKKISLEGTGGKYHSATDEVPTAPDQPSS